MENIQRCSNDGRKAMNRAIEEKPEGVKVVNAAFVFKIKRVKLRSMNKWNTK